MKLAAVILTMGNRPAELADLIRTVGKQQGDPIDIVVVGNGVKASELPDLGEVRTVDLPENLGIPAGRNEGYRVLLELPPEQRPEVILTLDDDGSLDGDQVAEKVRAAFAAEPRLGIISFRITDPETGTVQRRHVPRVRVGDPNHSSQVTTFLGGANATRTAVLEQVGLLPAEFFLFHEETDLAWRALDAGWTIEYRADLTLNHPATSPTRHATYHRMVARNRVWLAKRNLPWPLVPVYLAVWFALTVARNRDLSTLRPWLAGFAEGVRSSAGPRHPMRWRTVWRMTRLGRPPII
jgi:GT2 family glycosyltransferase